MIVSKSWIIDGRRRIKINGKQKYYSHYIWFLNTGCWPKWRKGKGELIHHKNLNPLDDRFENLEIKLNGEHIGFHNAQRIVSKETREKMADSRKRVEPYWLGKKNLEHSKRMTGENHPFYGKHHSEKTKEKMREAQKERRLNERIIIDIE